MAEMDYTKAQDVWKDIGQSVEFVVLELDRTKPLTELQDAITEFADRSQAINRSMNVRAADGNLKTAIGFSYTAWQTLFPNKPVPAELEEFKGLKGPEYSMPGTEGDIFIHVRANDMSIVYEVVRQYMTVLHDVTTVIDETKGFRNFEGRAIIGFIDGTEVPSAADSAEVAVVGDEDPEFVNGSYAFAQKWLHDMDFWGQLKTEVQEKAIGRHKYDDLELEDEEKFHNAHNVSAKVEIDGEERQIVRMNVPFSEPALNKTGTYFIGYSRYWSVTKAMLTQMVEMSDYLLTFSQLMSGQLFFIPSRELLGDIADGEWTE